MRHPYDPFFALLESFPEAPGFLELRARDPTTRAVMRCQITRRDQRRIQRWLARRGRYLDAFFGVATRNGHGGGKPHLVSLPALWADIDQPTLKIPATLPPPTAIVFTGGGHHLYWALKQALALDPARIATVDRILRGLAQHLQGDPGSAEAAHLLRVPGSLNPKYHPPATVSALVLEPTRRTPFDAFLPFAVPEPSPPTGHSLSFSAARTLQEGAVERVVEECAFVRWARDYQAEVSEPLWYALLTNLATLPSSGETAWLFSHRYPGFSERELLQKLAHARAWGRPTTCAKIHRIGFPDCPQCPWWGRVGAPAAIAFKGTARPPGRAGPGQAPGTL